MLNATDVGRANQVPLVVDLDGTLILSDMMWESFAHLLRRKPLAALASLFWLFHGRATFKQKLAGQVRVNAANLPYHPEFLDWLRAEKRARRKIVLATASDLEMARPVAQHIGLFDEVLASDGRTNLRDKAKRAALVQRFGERGFDYAGNSTPDLEVWRGAREAVIVNASERLLRRTAKCTKLGPIFPKHGSLLRALLQALRPGHWLKNLLVFVPIITAGEVTFWPMSSGAGAWLVLNCGDSGLSGLADVLNLNEDRQCPSKRSQPLASGKLPLALGLLLFPALFALSFIIAREVTLELVLLLVVYLTGAAAIASRSKRAAALDVLVRTVLYFLRLIAGIVVTGITCPIWLIACSLLVFPVLAVTERSSSRFHS